MERGFLKVVRMNIQGTVFALFFAALLAPSCARAATCAAPTPPTALVHPVFEEISYDFSKSLKDLNGAEYGAEAASPPSSHAIGRFFHSVVFGLRLKTEAISYNDGTVCSRIGNVDLDITVGGNTIFVAREFPRGSCAFNAILAHEHRHLELSSAFLGTLAPGVQERLDAIMRDIDINANPSESKEDKAARLEQVLRAFADELQNHASLDLRALQQARVDSPEEFERNKTICNGELAKIVQGAAF